MFDPSLSSWNAILSGYSLNGDYKEAINLFRQMQFQNVQPDRTNLAIILSSCAAMGLLQSGKQSHAASQKAGLHMDNYVASGLISIYSEGKKLETAKQILERLRELDVVCYNAMIAGLSLGSLDEKAFTLFKHMRVKGVMQTQFSFTTILNSCAKLHSELIDEGIEIFNSMQLEHGLEPNLDHHTAIIDTLGQAGRFYEAEVLMDQMPHKDDPIIWEVLLSTCRIHANVGLARRAARELFHLDPQNSAPYALLANIYTSLERWDDARAVRELMTQKEVRKNPGYSWIAGLSMKIKLNP
ncbi:Pentatricopeptide repeat [Dillenia turbinata]|uniref:Pentatricopeptide repeat n=1 Tax=Dillenia turbinata TaxID=194707 RepID=A0AAN8YXT3_9MAGN